MKAVLKIASVAQFEVRHGGFTKELSLLNNSLAPMSNHVQHCVHDNQFSWFNSYERKLQIERTYF